MVGDHQLGWYPGKIKDVAVKFAPRILLAVTALIALASAASAQDYPTRPITLVVGYAGGGGNDIMARVAAGRVADDQRDRPCRIVLPARGRRLGDRKSTRVTSS